MIDAHVHYWDQRGTPRPATPLVRMLGWSPTLLMFVARRVFPRDLQAFVGDALQAVSDYLPPDWRADAGPRLEGVVHVQAAWESTGPLGPVAETAWLESLDDGPLAIVGQADLSLGAGAGAVLDAHAAASHRFRGIRHMLSADPDPGVADFAPHPRMSEDPTWREGFAALAERGLSFDAWCYHPQLPQVAALAAAFPATPIALCHAGTPIGYGGRFAGFRDRADIAAVWEDGIARVAACPNVSVKLSGLAMPILGHGWHARDIPPGVAEVVDAVGPIVETVVRHVGVARCLFASNFPIDRVSLPYPTLLAAWDQVAAAWSEADRAGFFGDNARRFYRLT